MNNILIAGGAGFIGERLAAALASSGAAVHIVDTLPPGYDDEALDDLMATGRVRFDQIDLTNHSALDGFSSDYDIIANLAAILGVKNVLERPYATLRDNMLISETLIRFGKRQKELQRFLFTSSSEVYAGSLAHLNMPVPTPEDFPLALTSLSEPRTSYMLSKIYGEAMLHHSGLPFTIVRPHNIYGPRMGMRHVIPELLAKAHNAAPLSSIEVSSVDHKRSFCYIDDAIEMLMGALYSPAACYKVLNLGVETPEVTIKELAEIIIATVGKPLSIVGRPPTSGSPLRRAPKMDLMKQATASIGCSPALPLAEGVRRTYDWYRRHWFCRSAPANRVE